MVEWIGQDGLIEGDGGDVDIVVYICDIDILHYFGERD